MELTYLLNDVTRKTTSSNEDVIISAKSSDGRYTVKVKALKKIALKGARSRLDVNFNGKSLFFLNGYQSWTDTKECRFTDKEKNVYKLPKALVNAFAFDKYGDASFYEYGKEKLHGYDVFYVKGSKEFYSFNRNIKNAYLIYEINKKDGVISALSDIDGKTLNEGEEFTIFDYSSFNSVEEGLKAFDMAFKPLKAEKILGYTSWYNYYQNINSDIILRDLDGLDDRFNLFQIDDGYEKYVGDWLNVDKDKFPNGLKEIVEKIHSRGFKAGIWLAPFVAEEKSDLFTNHKELFKSVDGQYVKCGSNWSGFYALDFENEKAKEYIKKCLEYYMELGFDFFKLDFLYGVNLPAYEGKTRSMVAEEAYSFIREILKDRLILGCGATPFNAAGKFDYLRIGPDVSLKFDDIWYMKFMHRERISTKVTLQNTIFRSIFNNRLFLNDPDVFLLREGNISLSEKQKEALILINSLFGSVLMTSDNIAEYGTVANALVEEALDIFHNATNISHRKRDELIDISYCLNGKEKHLTYNTKKGVMTNGR